MKKKPTQILLGLKWKLSKFNNEYKCLLIKKTSISIILLNWNTKKYQKSSDTFPSHSIQTL
ncbi:hypothetical protein C4F50_02360 [Flavobacterium sp. KB82]|uniref:Uncharacterized protein n=1 Tax=Flavobacterium hungaricum TaxID=2082725 RepID=A0ABR9TEK9_9FLAO|nr:hypothetical protein [Flavobacterium hungaricum]